VVLVSATSINWIRDHLNSEPTRSVPTILIPTSAHVDSLLRKEIKKSEYSFKMPTLGQVVIGSLLELSVHRESVKNRKVSLVVTLGTFELANELLQMWPTGIFLLEEDAPTSGWQPTRWPKLVPRTSILTDAERVLRASSLDKVA
jgi:Leu/Phe-tRNA-protein transferase